MRYIAFYRLHCIAFHPGFNTKISEVWVSSKVSRGRSPFYATRAIQLLLLLQLLLVFFLSLFNKPFIFQCVSVELGWKNVKNSFFFANFIHYKLVQNMKKCLKLFLPSGMSSNAMWRYSFFFFHFATFSNQIWGRTHMLGSEKKKKPFTHSDLIESIVVANAYIKD